MKKKQKRSTVQGRARGPHVKGNARGSHIMGTTSQGKHQRAAFKGNARWPTFPREAPEGRISRETSHVGPKAKVNARGPHSRETPEHFWRIRPTGSKKKKWQ